jgi:hypothetical protein
MAPDTNVFRSHTPDEVDIPGLAKGGGIFITNSLQGNTYIITRGKEVASYEISEATYS